MFEHLAEHPRIIVTGPQRSGTTIAAKMIAADTGHRCVIAVDNWLVNRNRLDRALNPAPVVVQVPSLLRTLCDDPPDALIVLMRRPLDEILASQKRIGWEGNKVELERFGLRQGDSAAVKYRYWDRHTPPNSIEVAHEDLRGHPLWIDDRAHFGRHQTA